MASTGIIVTADLAEIAAGSIAMGLGGYLAAKNDAEHYAAERAREQLEVSEKPAQETAEVMEVFRSYGLTDEESAPVVQALCKRPEAWFDFMMRFELGLEKRDPKRALTSALTIGGAYVAGGFIPLGPYIVLSAAQTALMFSVVVTLIALAAFGYLNGRFTGTAPARGALQTVLIGGLAAAAAFAIARAISWRRMRLTPAGEPELEDAQRLRFSRAQGLRKVPDGTADVAVPCRMRSVRTAGPRFPQPGRACPLSTQRGIPPT